MQKHMSAKNQSEQMLYDGIVSDIHSNTVFVKNQFATLTSMQENLNKLEEQLNVL